MNTIFKRLSGLILIGFLTTSCAVKVPLSGAYFENNKKVGVIYKIDTISVYKSGAQGLLDMAVSSGRKYKEPLSIVDKTMDMEKEIKEQYQTIFSQKNKPLMEVDFDYDVKNMEKYEKPSKSDKKYHKYDVRELRSTGIDELLIIHVRYGLMISYYGMMETGRMGYCQIDSEIIDVTDNCVIYKNFSAAQTKIKGKWKSPPNYENLKEAVELAIEQTLEQERAKFK